MLMNAEDFIETRRTSQEVPGSLSTQPGWPSEGSTARLLTGRKEALFNPWNYYELLGFPRILLGFPMSTRLFKKILVS